MAGNDSEEPGVCVTLAKVRFVTVSHVFAIPYPQRTKNKADVIRLLTSKDRRKFHCGHPPQGGCCSHQTKSFGSCRLR